MPVFLAPHYDDVALSCGGAVATLAATGAPPLVVTVFGGTPGHDDLTAFARWQHERWGTDGTDTVAARQAEERAAAAALGCDILALPHLDAIYRGEQYLSDEALFGAVTPADRPLIEQIAAEVRPLLRAYAPGGAALYVPLGIGNHVDHQIVFAAGQLLAGQGYAVLAYEDFPYAALGDARAERLGAVAGVVGETVVVPIGAALERRIAAIGAYGSQLPTIFRFTDDWRAAVDRWAREVGGEAGPGERFWRLR